MTNIGFIGMGNMAQALVSGFKASGKMGEGRIYAYAPNQKKLEDIKQEFNRMYHMPPKKQ